MCSDQEFNWQPFALQDIAQPTEPHQPGLSCAAFDTSSVVLHWNSRPRLLLNFLCYFVGIPQRGSKRLEDKVVFTKRTSWFPQSSADTQLPNTFLLFYSNKNSYHVFRIFKIYYITQFKKAGQVRIFSALYS